MITIYAAALAASFAGGSFNDLAKSLHDTTDKPVFIVATTSRGDLKGFEYNAADANELSTAVRTNTGLTMEPGTDLIFHDGLVPGEKVMIRSRTARPGGASVAPKALEAKNFADGKVTFHTEKGEGLSLRGLNGFSKPVNVHWYFSDLAISVRAKDQPELDFLSQLGKGIGARFMNTPQEFKLEIDPMEIKARAIRTIQSEPLPTNGSDIMLKLRNFRIAAINSLSAAQMNELFSKQGNEVKIQIRPRSAQERLALGMIRDMEAYENSLQDPNPRQLMARGLMQRVDPNRPAYLTVDTFFHAQVEVPVLGENGRPGRVISLPRRPGSFGRGEADGDGGDRRGGGRRGDGGGR